MGKYGRYENIWITNIACFWRTIHTPVFTIQSTLIISPSLISNKRLSWRENLALFQHENLTKANKILWKREEIAPKEQFLHFSTIFSIYISNFRSQITYSFVKCGCSIYYFLKSANLTCQSMDISKCFRESLGLRDNESRLYIIWKYGGGHHRDLNI